RALAKIATSALYISVVRAFFASGRLSSICSTPASSAVLIRSVMGMIPWGVERSRRINPGGATGQRAPPADDGFAFSALQGPTAGPKSAASSAENPPRQGTFGG